MARTMNQDEGEFKKLFRFYALNYCTTSGTNVSRDAELYLRKQEEILDEARKDIGEGFPKGRIETKTTEETRLLGYILDLRARFLNWFGDAEK